MDDEDFQSRLDKIHEDHARFMALVESMPPLTEQQKEENRARLFAEEEPLRIAKREELSRQALQGDPHAKLYPPPDEIFPPLPWKPRIFLKLSRFHWKANIELCKRIHSMMRQPLLEMAVQKCTARQWSLPGGIGGRWTNMSDLIYSHVRAVRSTKRVSGPLCIPTGELLDLERQLAKVYRVHRNQWTPEYRAGLKAARVVQKIKMAPMEAMMKDILKGQAV